MVLHDDERGQMYANLFNCQLGSWPIKYLGVPVCASRLHVEDWIPAEEKMYKKL